MSRIGLKPILINPNITITVSDSIISVKGPKGTLSSDKRPEVKINITPTEVSFEIEEKSKTAKNASAYLGLTRSLVNNMVKGVTDGFEKKLELVGVGYRAKTVGADTLNLTLGFSHPVDFKLPAGIQAEVTDNMNITIKGNDKYLVGQVAANIRKLRKPEPYKGKGIKYAGEVIRRKQGKSGKV
jgi:large subunit ribosomal protein L6